MTFQSRKLGVLNYRSFAKESRASSATTYGLVAVLFEELGETLNLIIESVRRGEDTRLFQCWANARAILSGLDKELNFEVAGDLAQTLRIIYTEAAKRIQWEGRELCVERIESAREMIQEIEKAWTESVALN
jgi:flagellin-specific chaperone FliS